MEDAARRKRLDKPGSEIGPAAAVAAAAPWPSPMPDGREFCPCFETRRLARRVNAYYETHVGPLGITVQQFSLLGFVLARPGSAVQELARMLDVDRTTVTRNLALLLAREFLTEAGDPADKRRRCFHITPEGKAAWRAGLAAWRAAQDDFKREIGGDDAFAGLIGLLRGTAAMLPAGFPAASGPDAAS